MFAPPPVDFEALRGGGRGGSMLRRFNLLPSGLAAAASHVGALRGVLGGTGVLLNPAFRRPTLEELAYNRQALGLDRPKFSRDGGAVGMVGMRRQRRRRSKHRKMDEYLLGAI